MKKVPFVIACVTLGLATANFVLSLISLIPKE